MSLSMMLVMVVLLLLSVFLPSAMDSKRSEKRVWHIITTSNCNNKYKCCTTVVHYDYTASLLLHTTQYDPILHSIQYPRILNTKYYTASPILHIAEYLPPHCTHFTLFKIHSVPNPAHYTVFLILHTAQYSPILHTIQYSIPHPAHYTVYSIPHLSLYPSSYTVSYSLHSFPNPPLNCSQYWSALVLQPLK